MQKLKILLTNDDGIETFSTLGLAELLRQQGHEVFTVIPLENMSGVSGAMSFRKNIFTMNIDENSIAVTGTPCDCINLVVSGVILENNFDLIISGINKGENAGLTVHDSGTVAAARRAKTYGYNSIAVSYADYGCDKESMENCNRYLVKLLENENYFMHQRNNEYVNINIPHINKVKDNDFRNVKNIITQVGKGAYKQKFKKLDENHFKYDNADMLDKTTFRPGCDHDTLSKGLVSISYIEI